MATLRVDIASEFTGAAAFKKAGKASSGLEKGIKSLGKTMGIALSAQAVVAFGKASVKAFMDDQKSAVLLANAVKNLGIEMEAPAIEGFIQHLSRQASVADDQLRPAMQALLTTTGSVTKSQKMLADAIEISRGSGVDLATVAQDLSNAYVGNTKGLKKYNLGLTQAELKASSFVDIQSRLNKQFAGSNAAYLETYAGKMEALTVASGEAQETIGKGLVDALVILVGQDEGVTGLSDRFATLAKDISQVVTGMAAFYKSVEDGGSVLTPIINYMKWFTKHMPSIYKILGFFKRFSPENSTDATGTSTIGDYNAAIDAAKNRKAKQKLEADADKRAKLLAAAALKQAAAAKAAAAEAKKQAALKKASAMFDMEQIQLIAALKGNISEQDRKRLELQFALATDNVEEAKKLTYQLAISQGMTVKLAAELASLPKANNPFAAWKGYLDDVELQAKRIAEMKFQASAAAAAAAASTASAGKLTPKDIVDMYRVPDLTGAELEKARERGKSYGSGNEGIVKVFIDGKEVVNAVVDQAMSGNNAYLNRRLGGFD
jgi:hypothetical protein